MAKQPNQPSCLSNLKKSFNFYEKLNFSNQPTKHTAHSCLHGKTFLFRPWESSTRKAADLVEAASEQSAAEIEAHLKGTCAYECVCLCVSLSLRLCVYIYYIICILYDIYMLESLILPTAKRQKKKKTALMIHGLVC